ncbi:UDP-N-acetylglucosamine 4,6-dehydratase [Chromobacterium subtsugae]|uniref:UDP-N-acetylglucosamine 4,6-dehydratase n=3 Tax=Chromobacterium subtsugae TaxID=251747 RepID=A0ABS7FFU5_9NEIS|nr:MULTISPECIES: UDP-N-acetylglucosamine 4,6-dehydratase [Chromobacterium]KUM03981.1 UDP-N-acetylglucosamine 4,6-dehydratase [Chromobacterium subtsugae]KZE86441.1 UDP-N-acetylglucosamine 4,6-dehydratase [Chromobacterium sp. F49]MBW7567701.1 UDP-N-acetylglucosamine 4,6-dehydratase [Chromobacterium subtsugae]MBW8288927.1 UDP-N-acetylglucosamine 4,6-dehydratase [Chromobacterium subtsugae]OBU85685.1 UDP-N-acetylglucosamine 4,6-dehydratase [Chromobacterium subtsugae]
MDSTLKLIGRTAPLFGADITQHKQDLEEIVAESSFLVIGGAGSIGQAVVREIFKRNPKVLHVVDISENNMVELVRDLRSTLGYIDGDFRTFSIDCNGPEFDALMSWGKGYDYVLNLSALKHVRSEKDPFTLMRLIKVNILNTISTLKHAKNSGAKKYFCVSTDKAANPVNMMGASKRIMEKFLMRESLDLAISTARFANVAFSDGSLLHGFNQRFTKRQPISAPSDIQRYFVTPQESGELCLMSCLLGQNREIFFPKPSHDLQLTSFSDIASRYLEQLGYTPYPCSSEEEAREKASALIADKKWPCYFFSSDTTGEKSYEEFFTEREILDMARFQNIGIIKNDPAFDEQALNSFLDGIQKLNQNGRWEKIEIVSLFEAILPEFSHLETGKYLDGRM